MNEAGLRSPLILPVLDELSNRGIEWVDCPKNSVM